MTECILGSTKPVLSTYPQGYQLPSVVPKDLHSTVLYPSHFDNDGVLRQKAQLMEKVHF